MKKLIILVFMQLSALTLLAQAWTELADVPESLTFPIAVVLNGNIHLIGGGAIGGATDLHLRYTVATDSWDTLAPVPYLAQQPGGASASGKIHYFGGGFPNSGTPLNKHFVYNPISNTWDTAASIPVNRVIHEAVTIKDSIYVMGGQADKLRFELYATTSNSWKSLNNLPDQNFWYGSFATVNDTMYRFGGGGYLAPSDAAQRYKVQTDSWVNTSILPEELHASAAASIGDSIYIVGGFNSLGVSDRVWIYDVHTQTYQSGFNLPEPRNYHSLVSVGNCIYAIGGQDATVDKSIIRHCLGDTADYTGIVTVNQVKMDINLSYTNGRLKINVGKPLNDNRVSVKLFDALGRQLLSQHIFVDASGFGEVDLTQTIYLNKTSIYIATVLYNGQRESVKVLVGD